VPSVFGLAGVWSFCVPFCYTVLFHFVTCVSFLSLLYAHFMLDLCLVLCYNIVIKGEFWSWFSFVALVLRCVSLSLAWFVFSVLLGGLEVLMFAFGCLRFVCRLVSRVSVPVFGWALSCCFSGLRSGRPVGVLVRWFRVSSCVSSW
jgi:hypothetical protein